MAVVFENANGGIILTASHNPKEWNALKLLNNKGEFISGADGAHILALAEAEDFDLESHLQDVISVDSYNGDIVIEEWNIEDVNEY